MARFQDRVVWITGASAGIGRELAVAFAAEGAHVALSARRPELLRKVADRVEGLGRRALCVPCDVTDDAQVAAAVESVVGRLGRLDVAVANAGYAVVGRFEELSADDWRRQFEVNVIGLVSTARHALPRLRATRGRLALMASVASMVPAPENSPYGASKAAVRSIGQSLSVELHGSGVSCTTLHPGFVESDISRVDNQGVFHPDRPDRRPLRLMWPTDRAARVMVRAIHRRRREYVFTGHGVLAGALGRHWPSLLHFAMSRATGLRRG